MVNALTMEGSGWPQLFPCDEIRRSRFQRTKARIAPLRQSCKVALSAAHAGSKAPGSFKKLAAKCAAISSRRCSGEWPPLFLRATFRRCWMLKTSDLILCATCADSALDR